MNKQTIINILRKHESEVDNFNNALFSVDYEVVSEELLKLFEDALSAPIHEFFYNDNINEGLPTCISLHRTRVGAIKALDAHRQVKLDDYNKCQREAPSDIKFGAFEEWGIKARTVIE